jgi:hypothetical protein
MNEGNYIYDGIFNELKFVVRELMDKKYEDCISNKFYFIRKDK